VAPFRFRAAAALDLRRRQEDAAAAALGQAEAKFHEVSSTFSAAEAARRQALTDQAAQAREGIDAATLFWHRNWIIRLKATVDDCAATVRAQSVAVHDSRRKWQLARRRRLVLERLRDRSLKRHRADEQQAELKDMDELARIRFVMPDMGSEEEEGAADGD
jgi:flagellar export protein FliJ